MMNSGRLDELIQKYVQGNLAQSEVEELSRHLQQEEAVESRRKLRLALKADAYLEEAAAEMGQETDWNEHVPEGKAVSLKPRIWTMVGVAASIAAVITVGFLGWFRQAETLPIENGLGVATVLRIDGKGHTRPQHPLSRGDALQAGDELTMSEGVIELVFRDSGVHAIATAPLTLTAESSERIFLHRGDVKLHVPPQGIGFVVETAEREITDLGTVFVVTARKNASQVFVLDGQVAIEKRSGNRGRLMTEGEVASFGQNGKLSLLKQKTDGMPELSQPSFDQSVQSLSGKIFGFKNDDLPQAPAEEDLMGMRFDSLIRSGFQDRSSLDGLDSGSPLRFAGIAGAYKQFAERNGLHPDVINRAGWLTWYSGQLTPPGPGRYRFWGYADNNLLVAIDGKPVFDGSRYDSAFREIVHVQRQDHPAWPCLNALAGFASGPWIEVGDDPIQFDLLFGEKHGNLTFGLLLVEREGEDYEKTFWGQPKWPLLLTEEPSDTQLGQLGQLRKHMEEKLMGSFSVSSDAIWDARKTSLAR